MTDPQSLAEGTPIEAEFLEELKANGIKESTLMNYRNSIKTLERFEKNLEDLTKDDFRGWANELQEEYAEGTQNKIKICVKRYIKWLHTGDLDGGEYPECVSWLKYSDSRRKLPREILSHDEIKRMAGHTKTTRDRAMLWVNYESGMRVGELLDLRIKDIEFDNYGAIIHANGKSGERAIRLIESVPDLKLWLERHPKPGDSDAYLWASPMKDPTEGHLSRPRWTKILKDCAENAGVNKRIYPHLLRHSRATHLAGKGVNEAQLREIFGWSKGSEMPSVYVHLSQRDVDSTLLNLYGINVEPSENQLESSVKRCPYCRHENSPNAKFCQGCNAPLEPTVVKSSEVKLREQDELTRRIVQRLIERVPEVVVEVLKERDIRDELKRHSEVAEV